MMLPAELTCSGEPIRLDGLIDGSASTPCIGHWIQPILSSDMDFSDGGVARERWASN